MTSRLIFVLAALFTLPASAAEKREETVEYTLDFTPGKKLSVHARNGGITLKTWERDQVFVRAIKKAKASDEEDAEELLETTTIEIKETDNGIEIRTKHPDNKWKIFKNWNISVNYTVTVPQSVSLNLEAVNGSISVPSTTGNVKSETVNGSIKINGTRGAIDVETVNGKINLTEIIGGVKAETVNGSIEIAIAEQIQDNIRAEAVNGGLQLSLPSDFQGRIQAESTIGHIDTEFPIEVKGRVSGRISKSIKGDLNGGKGPNIKLQTLNGGIDIKQL
ncbi:MAG: DUF4097 family beta strand repeat protein [Candidatus Latescibacteria bacterium]|nr:DUF4097 family beta strand repeat protein [Candidatus Latescibacterota bacterium]